MLCLSRKKKESVTIGGIVEVKIYRVKGDRVWLTFEAPKEVSIVRTEIIGRDEGDSPAA